MSSIKDMRVVSVGELQSDCVVVPPGGTKLGLWFSEGVEQALAARHLLDVVNQRWPKVDVVLLGPKSSLCFFELDDRVAAYIPLNELEPRRTSQSWFGWWLQCRAQRNKLAGLSLSTLVGLYAGEDGAQGVPKTLAKAFWRLVRKVSCTGSHAMVVDWVANWSMSKGPALQAGKAALTQVSKLHRKVPPDAIKVFVVLGHAHEPVSVIRQRIDEAQASVDARLASFGALGTGVGPRLHATSAIIADRDRLHHRRIREAFDGFLIMDWSEALGHLAYAEWVVGFPRQIPRICEAMGRSDRLLLPKSHTD